MSADGSFVAGASGSGIGEAPSAREERTCILFWPSLTAPFGLTQGGQAVEAIYGVSGHTAKVFQRGFKDVKVAEDLPRQLPKKTELLVCGMGSSRDEEAALKVQKVAKLLTPLVDKRSKLETVIFEMDASWLDPGAIDIDSVQNLLEGLGFAYWARRPLDNRGFDSAIDISRIFMVACRQTNASNILLAQGKDRCLGACVHGISDEFIPRRRCWECSQKDLLAQQQQAQQQQQGSSPPAQQQQVQNSNPSAPQEQAPQHQSSDVLPQHQLQQEAAPRRSQRKSKQQRAQEQMQQRLRERYFQQLQQQAQQLGQGSMVPSQQPQQLGGQAQAMNPSMPRHPVYLHVVTLSVDSLPTVLKADGTVVQVTIEAIERLLGLPPGITAGGTDRERMELLVGILSCKAWQWMARMVLVEGPAGLTPYQPRFIGNADKHDAEHAQDYPLPAARQCADFCVRPEVDMKEWAKKSQEPWLGTRQESDNTQGSNQGTSDAGIIDGATAANMQDKGSTASTSAAAGRKIVKVKRTGGSKGPNSTAITQTPDDNIRDASMMVVVSPADDGHAGVVAGQQLQAASSADGPTPVTEGVAGQQPQTCRGKTPVSDGTAGHQSRACGPADGQTASCCPNEAHGTGIASNSGGGGDDQSGAGVEADFKWPPCAWFSKDAGRVEVRNASTCPRKGPFYSIRETLPMAESAGSIVLHIGTKCTAKVVWEPHASGLSHVVWAPIPGTGGSLHWPAELIASAVIEGQRWVQLKFIEPINGFPTHTCEQEGAVYDLEACREVFEGRMEMAAKQHAFNHLKEFRQSLDAASRKLTALIEDAEAAFDAMFADNEPRKVTVQETPGRLAKYAWNKERILRARLGKLNRCNECEGCRAGQHCRRVVATMQAIEGHTASQLALLGDEANGARVEVYWADDKMWYLAQITDTDKYKLYDRVVYKDGEVEQLNLFSCHEIIRVVNDPCLWRQQHEVTSREIDARRAAKEHEIKLKQELQKRMMEQGDADYSAALQAGAPILAGLLKDVAQMKLSAAALPRANTRSTAVRDARIVASAVASLETPVGAHPSGMASLSTPVGADPSGMASSHLPVRARWAHRFSAAAFEELRFAQSLRACRIGPIEDKSEDTLCRRHLLGSYSPMSDATEEPSSGYDTEGGSDEDSISDAHGDDAEDSDGGDDSDASSTGTRDDDDDDDDDDDSHAASEAADSDDDSGRTWTESERNDEGEGVGGLEGPGVGVAAAGTWGGDMGEGVDGGQEGGGGGQEGGDGGLEGEGDVAVAGTVIDPEEERYLGACSEDMEVSDPEIDIDEAPKQRGTRTGQWPARKRRPRQLRNDAILVPISKRRTKPTLTKRRRTVRKNRTATDGLEGQVRTRQVGFFPELVSKQQKRACRPKHDFKTMGAAAGALHRRAINQARR